MKTLLMNVIKPLKKINWLYAAHREIKLLKLHRKKSWEEAVKQFEEKPPKHGSLSDYKRALRRHRANFKEYSTYEFWRLNRRERMNYLTEQQLKSIYRKMEGVDERKWLDNKLMTHLKFAKFMRRDWLCPSISSFDSFCQFVSSRDCIVKPWMGSLGIGIFMVEKDKICDLQELYNRCRDNGLFVEERVRSCKELEAFHPHSLNTIRVMTMLNGNRFEVIGCMFRMGVGDHVVDNGSAGGILAPVDSKTGVIVGDGRDKEGKAYACHPDTGKTIKGSVIPHWDKVIDACKEMASLIPEKAIAGWDVCVLDEGEVELIEVNSGPNIMGLQVANGYGFKSRIQTLGKTLLGYDLMKLIPVWSRPLSNYEKYVQYNRRLHNPDLLLKDYVEYSLKQEG